MPPLAAGVEFLDAPLAVFGVLLVAGALISGLARRPFLSLTAAFVVAGFLLGEGGLEVLELDPTSQFVQGLAVVALIVILFRDGLEVEEEMLQEAWHLPLRKLVLAMPLTCVLVALATHALTDLGWTESFLVGALLSPTDPVLSSAVITNPRVPRLIRHSLNLESGLNDGLALPAVLAFTAAAAGDEDFVWWQFVLQDVCVGLAVRAGGGVRGVAADAERARARTRDQLASEGALRPGRGVRRVRHGDAAAGGQRLHRGVRGGDRARHLAPGHRASASRRSSEDIVEIVKLGVFVVFGAIITLDGLFGDGWAAVGIVAFTLLVARPVAVFVSLAGTRQVDTAEKAFMAWFGPKGVATMAFALFVLGSAVPDGERIANIAALAVLVSIVVHGLTDHAGVQWIARRNVDEN